MIDRQHIPLVINSYLNFKTYSITFINCLDRIVWQKLNEEWETWKRSKASWMGHGAWMGIAWRNMEDGCMGLKHSSWNVTCFGGLDCSGIQTHVRLPIETWHVSMGGRYWGSSFETHVLWCMIFDQLKWMPNHHQNMTSFHVNLLWHPCNLCVETHARHPCNSCVETHTRPPQIERHIYDLLLK
jgi:hypothetical protein